MVFRFVWVQAVEEVLCKVSVSDQCASEFALLLWLVQVQLVSGTHQRRLRVLVVWVVQWSQWEDLAMVGDPLGNFWRQEVEMGCCLTQTGCHLILSLGESGRTLVQGQSSEKDWVRLADNLGPEKDWAMLDVSGLPVVVVSLALIFWVLSLMDCGIEQGVAWVEVLAPLKQNC